MRELSLHVLDIAQNSISAGATEIRIDIVENLKSDRLQIKISDNGKGMDSETLVKVADPFTTSRSTRKVGLGIPLLKEAAESCNGSLAIRSEKGQGTDVSISFQLSHIDRMPMGDMASTLLSLIPLNPDIHFLFRYLMDDREFELDTEPIKRELQDVPLSDPLVIKFLRETITRGIEDLHPKENIKTNEGENYANN